MASTYWELLKHPNWQRKRLEILQRSRFSCEDCGASDKTLHVHHTYYEKGLKPWEYPDISLQPLCEDCHQKAQNLMTLLQRQVGMLGSTTSLQQLYGFALAMNGFNAPDEPIEIFSFEVALGVAAYWNLNAWQIISSLNERSIDSRKLSEMSQAKFAKSIQLDQVETK